MIGERGGKEKRSINVDTSRPFISSSVPFLLDSFQDINIISTLFTTADWFPPVFQKKNEKEH